MIIMERHDAYDHIYVKEGESFQNRFGLFRHSDLIGKPYGSQVKPEPPPPQYTPPQSLQGTNGLRSKQIS